MPVGIHIQQFFSPRSFAFKIHMNEASLFSFVFQQASSKIHIREVPPGGVVKNIPFAISSTPAY